MDKKVNKQCCSLNAHKFWFVPTTYSIVINKDYQLDMPITPRAFMFQVFEILNHPNPTRSQINATLIDFYAAHGRPQRDVWSCFHIKTIVKMNKGKLYKKWFYEYDLVVKKEPNERKVIFHWQIFR